MSNAFDSAPPENRDSWLGPLVVRGATDLSGIAEFRALHALELAGCAVEDLSFVHQMPGLTELRLIACTISDLSGLQGHAALAGIEINFCPVTDVSPLRELPGIRRITLFGNPLSDESWNDVLPALAEQEIEKWAGPPIILRSTDDEWRLARQVWAHGVGLCWGRIPLLPAAMVKPGPGTRRPIDFLEIGEADLEHDLKRPDFAQSSIVTKIDAVQDWADQNPERFSVDWRAGTSRDVFFWVNDAKDVLEEERRHYIEFASHFTGELFYLEHPRVCERAEERDGVRLPGWFKRSRAELMGGVRPGIAAVSFHFEKFAHKAISRNGGWYQIGLMGYFSDQYRDLLRDKCGLYPIGAVDEPDHSDRSLLAINLRNDDDQRIFELDPVGMLNMRRGHPLEITATVFPTLGSLYEHVSAVRSGDHLVEADRLTVGDRE